MARHVTVNYMPVSTRGGRHEGKPERLERVGLLELARHVRRHDLDAGSRLDVVFVNPLDTLPPALLDGLEAYGAAVHDGSGAYAELAARFPRLLGRVWGPWHQHPFGFAYLRWLVADALFDDDHLVVFDGDVLPNVPFREIEEAFAGQTFVATSTCFASIADRNWFRVWERALGELDADFDGYVEARAGFRSARGCPWAAVGEELLAATLIEAGELRQDPLPDDAPLWVVPRPHVLPKLYWFVKPPTGPLEIPTPLRYARVGGRDEINGKPLAFWHLIKPFQRMLGATAYLAEEGRLADTRVYPCDFYEGPVAAKYVRELDPHHHETPFPYPPPAFAPLSEELLRVRRDGVRRNGRVELPFSSAAVYEYFFERHDLSLLFNDRTWPFAGVWAE